MTDQYLSYDADRVEIEAPSVAGEAVAVETALERLDPPEDHVEIFAWGRDGDRIAITVKGYFDRPDLAPPLRPYEPIAYDDMAMPLGVARQLRDQLNRLLLG